MQILCRILLGATVLCTGFTATYGQKKPAQTIHFQLTAYNNLVIPALLNQQDTVRLMLHTAASDVTITEDAARKMKSLRFDGQVDSVQSWGGNANTADFSKHNQLRVGKWLLNDLTIWKNQHSGQETDGKAGLHLFEGQVVMVDFDRNELKTRNKLPKNTKHYQKFKLEVQDDMLFLRAICLLGTDSVAHTFLIHTGYGGSVLLDDEFVRTHQLGQRIPITGEKKLSDAYGNVLTTKKGALPGFILGDSKLENLPVGFFEGAIGQQSISILGSDVLKRFNWIIDADRSHIYLKPNALFKTPFATF
ncbi:MAG TPA: aspartyl protease family protein [Saprospiraceae bacterium]|nr:aspartyl protease family protein [Saprospiraceae bacterium]